MSERDDEIRRLERLRDRQLSARDPMVYTRKIQTRISQQRRNKKRLAWGDLITNLPYKWWGVILGALIGVLIWVVLNIVGVEGWVDLIGLAVALVLAIVGFFFGQAFDLRDELRDLVK